MKTMAMLLLGLLAGFATLHAADPVPVQGPAARAPFFGIRIVDDITGRGVPLVELHTVNQVRHVTDNAGWIAFAEPGLADHEVFWHISGPGIEVPKDGFGYAGVRAVARPGTTTTVKVRTTTIARRVGRLTGQGLFRDSELLGFPHPMPNLLKPGVTGQDSVQAVRFGGRIFWLWGDTIQAHYPLGNFHTTCATTPLASDPEAGLKFDYFTDPTRPASLRAMMPSDKPGVIWMFGLAALTDAAGQERMFAGFTRRKGLVPPDEVGVAEFDVARGTFRKIADVPIDEEFRIPSGHAVRARTADGDHVYFCAPYACTRIPATPEGFARPEGSEMLRFDEMSKEWRWQTAMAPTSFDAEKSLLASGAMNPGQARYQLTNAVSGELIKIHGASILWNAWRERYILIGVQAGGKGAESYLGEVWYAESSSITGPWHKAVRIATHPRYSFYNPVHHEFFDTNGGRTIYFEGTYTKEFSGNPIAVSRYDYNQLLYRLDLDDPRLIPAR